MTFFSTFSHKNSTIFQICSGHTTWSSLEPPRPPCQEKVRKFSKGQGPTVRPTDRCPNLLPKRRPLALGRDHVTFAYWSSRDLRLKVGHPREKELSFKFFGETQRWSRETFSYSYFLAKFSYFIFKRSKIIS